MNNLLAVLDGTESGLGDGALVSIIAIVLVFVILAAIIGITYAVNYFIQKAEKTQNANTDEKNASQTQTVKTVDIDCEEAEVAVLIASIDYRNEIKQDIKVVSVKEIK